MIPQLSRGQRQTAIATTIPSAIAGINAVKSIAMMEPDEAIFAVNILPEDFGMEVRDGFVEWANGWTGGAAKTVMPFEGNVSADDRLFVASPEGIFDVTEQGDIAPEQVVTFPSSAGQAGVCHSVNYGNDEGDRFLLVTDGENGYYVWTQNGDTWEKIEEDGQGIIGVDPALFDFVMIWKSRVWFVERASGHAWFLAQAEAFLGAVNQFNFGDQFRFGGPLVSLHNWTLDGGNGIDDFLVGFSGAGDAIIYQGSDPTSKADFGLVGSWYVGELPFGNRVASEFSGELYILSVQGLLPMSQILNGAGIENPQVYLTNKISPFVREIMDESRNDFGWHVHIHPKQSLLFINTPPRVGREQVAFTLYFGHESWGTIAGLNKSHTANWRGEVYWTDINRNKLFVQRGSVDGVYLDPVIDGDPQAIDWQVLGSYNDLGQPAKYKRVQYIRPMFIGSGDTPAFTVEAYYDYAIVPLLTAPVFTGTAFALWGNQGDYTFSLESEGADVLIMSVQAGATQITGVDDIDVTLGAHPLATLTWSVANSRYEGASVGVQAFLIGQVGLQVSTTIDPDTLPAHLYILIPALIGPDAGFRPPLFDFENVPLPPATPFGLITPAYINGSGAPVQGEANWDEPRWGGGLSASDNPRGANGLGRHVAINIRGKTGSPTTLVSFDVIWDVGGLM